MISRTRSSGSAYSCLPRSKLTNDTPGSITAGAAAVAAAETDTPARPRSLETPSRANSSRNNRCGFNILIVLSPSAPLMMPSRRSGSTVAPAPASSLFSAISGVAPRARRFDRLQIRPERRDRSRRRASHHQVALREAQAGGVAQRPGSTTPWRLASPSRLRGPSGMWARLGSRAISPTSSSRNPNASSASWNATKCVIRHFDNADRTAVAGFDCAAASGFGRLDRCGLLAIATLDVLGKRGDFLDRGRKFLGTARLLLRRGRSLGCGATGFLRGSCDLLRTPRTFLQR